MKNTRKLIPAVVMLLVSAVLMSTASFAWFSMNDEVTATGMDVTATTPASLEIAATSSGEWTYGVTLNKDVDGLHAITRYNNAWYVPGPKNIIELSGKAKYEIDDTYDGELTFEDCWTEVDLNYLDGTEGAADGGTQYALTCDLFLRTNNGTATSGTAIKFNATASVSGDSDLKGGVKVYLKVGSTVYELDSTTPVTDTTWIAPLTSAGADSSIKVTVIVVYDGQEYTYINNNKADLDETAISLTFGAAA